ncbi:hypothetical protein CANCADRAFT_52934 [Tortispora caseinolytica NRRL Y-17796]|uniref:Amine oxidase n=1 Tax=Tortispora caseinolytica NRRL Y-17796 TaxID=767744 RepID=A0A1E4TAK7_9ASCO|nr:hypothetical protein CANCADRAFT_52934 [Tortispora caseinolytica NRRL Y-17796]
MVHPLAPLSIEEINYATSIVKKAHPDKEVLIKACSLEEPPKAFMVPYLEAEKKGRPLLPPPRRAYVPFYYKGTSEFFDCIVNLTSGQLETRTAVASGFHAHLDVDELREIEALCMKHPDVVARISTIGLPDDWEATCDPWIFGNDGSELAKTRLFQIFMYARPKSQPDANHYAHPLAFSPIFETATKKLVTIQELPTGLDDTLKATKPFVPSFVTNSYLPEDQPSLRPLKPLRVIQPEGASYTIKDGRMEWQGWSFFVSLNYREGPVLYDISFKGRSIAYRMALSDMAVPYGDPRQPYLRKEAFDLGDAGAGNTANNLELGCDCLGNITYLDLPLVDANGTAHLSKNVLCIHEEDNGIGWKHTNYRTNRACVVRNRELVLQTIITVANYEYILMFRFNQAADITYEVRATGILSTQPIDEGITQCPFGTVVHPQVLAAIHQHIFCLRFDPAIDGHQNSVVYQETELLPFDENPYRTGYKTVTTLAEKAGGYDLNWERNRTFKVINPNVLNPVNKQPVAYKIHLPVTQHLVADPTSSQSIRAEFADHHIYVTKYRDGELFAGGKHTNQSPGGAGLKSFIRPNDRIVNDDIVLWIQMGLQHVPRIEDFPVMPIEDLKCVLRPVNFFDKNPALDVPPSSQSFNKSTLETGAVSGTEMSSCCQKL